MTTIATTVGKAYHTILSQRRSERKGRLIKRYCSSKKHMSPLRSLRLYEKTVCQIYKIGWFSAYTKIDNICQIKPELLN